MSAGCRHDQAATERSDPIADPVVAPTRQESPRTELPAPRRGLEAAAARLEGINELTRRTKARLQRIMVPQNRPEDSVHLEIALMQRGIYYPDVPLYDEAWRRRERPERPPDRYQAVARRLAVPFEVERTADYAIVYFPGENRRRNGPWFLRNTNAGWVLETSVVYEKIIYDLSSQWYALDGDYPYLELLQRVYSMRRVTSRRHGAAWAVDPAAP